MVGESNGRINFSDKLLLTKIQVLKNCKAFANGSSTNINFLENQLF